MRKAELQGSMERLRQKLEAQAQAQRAQQEALELELQRRKLQVQLELQVGQWGICQWWRCNGALLQSGVHKAYASSLMSGLAWVSGD